MEPKGINIAAVPQTAISVLTNPSGFFMKMPKTGGFVEPLVFAVIMGVISGLIQTLFSIFNFAAGMAMGVASVIIVPIMVAIFGFVGAAIMFVIWKLMGSEESYETAYRCGAYISVLTPITTVLGIIPYVGTAIGIVLMTLFIVLASIVVHRIPSGKAWLVFGIIGAVLIILNIGGQFAARRFAGNATQFQKEMEETSKNIQELAKKTEDARKAAESLQKQMEKGK